MLYSIFSTVAFWLILPFWLLAGIFNRKLLYGFKEKLGFFKFQNNQKKSIVFYGVSVGETMALENLLKSAKNEFQNYNIIVVTGTKTGQDLAQKKYSSFCDLVTYFPFDFPFCVKSFLKKTNPAAVCIMETEMWPNFINITSSKKVPLFIINGRISDRTYRSYKKLSFLFKPLLRKYTKILTQSNLDNERLISIGANPETTKNIGNIKFDLTTGKTPPTLDSNGRIIIAGSTHSTEDEIILSAYTKIKKEFNDVKLLIAPRHPERNDFVYGLIQNTGLSVGKKSNSDNFIDKDIILLDTMGELSSLYSICYFSVIGGSFNKTGGHNPLECVVYNKPVISGSNVKNFKDIYAIITNYRAGTIVKDETALYDEMKKLLSDEDYYKNACLNCQKVFEENSGATNRTIEELKQIV